MWDLVRFLPPDSALSRVRDPAPLWSPESYILAIVVDHLALANWQRGGGKGKKPKPLQRPGEVESKQEIKLDRFDTPAAFDAWHEAQMKTK